MSGNAYYRFFCGDYLRDTIHLGWLEDCAYRRLIDLYQSQDGPIRNDRSYILRAVRATEPEQQAAVDCVLAEFFTLKADGWHQNRCDAEVRFRARARDHGASAAKARWEKANKSIELDATAMPEQCQPEPEPEPEPLIATRKRRRKTTQPRSACPKEFEVSDEMHAWAITQGLADHRIMLETEQWMDHHRGAGSLMADWDAAWRKWIRNAVKFAKA